ncbi:MAG: phytanoyl-CoA dioxygenase family protein [Thermoanaerobaculia bacterium]|nr:phytanoyl-CoA dioxygenase family protein [Thermoanaerobaculia bacterium]
MSFLRAFEEDGIAFPIPVLDADEVRKYRSAFEHLELLLGGKKQNLSTVHLHFDWARELVAHPAVLDAVEPLLGPDLLVLSTLILNKHPHDPAFVGWHQDGTYWNLHSAPTASAWIALTDSTRANGCMRVIPGSHRETMLPHECTYAENSLLGRGEQVAAEVDESRAIDVELRAGQMSIHQNAILHSSPPNGSDHRRIGFIIRFVTPEFAHATAPVLLARGRAEGDRMELWEAPPPTDVKRAIAEREAYVEAMAAKPAESR